MNSFYGVLGSAGCRFYDPRLAGSITRIGHWILNFSRKFIEKEGYRVIYGDTDSLFVNLGKDNYKAAHQIERLYQKYTATCPSSPYAGSFRW
jgi:DNA polymerase-2